MSLHSIRRASDYDVRVSVSPEIRKSTDWDRLWSSIAGTNRPWRVLALVPGGAGTSAATCLQIAVALAETGTRHLRTPVQVANATEIAPAEIADFWDELNQHIGTTSMMIVALSPLDINPASLALAKKADGALLCIVLGEISTPEAKQALDRVGAPHFLGSAIFHLAASAGRAAAKDS
jgi:hypothetical protein